MYLDGSIHTKNTLQAIIIRLLLIFDVDEKSCTARIHCVKNPLKQIFKRVLMFILLVKDVFQ